MYKANQWDKPLYLQTVMGKYLKLIGVLVLALLLWQTPGNAVAGNAASGNTTLSDMTLSDAALTGQVLSDAALNNLLLNTPSLDNTTPSNLSLHSATSDDTFIAGNSVSAGDAADIQAAAVRHQDEECFTSPRLPYLPVAELASTAGHIQSLVLSRVQRSYLAEYIFSLKDWVAKLAQREAVLSLHKEKLFDVAAYCRCRPACEYYIFTLRRILI